MKRMGKKGASMVVAAALMAMLTVGLMFASAQPPQPFTIKGNVTYMNNGTRVPAGWTVNISDLTKGWSISTTTVDTPPVVDYNYKVDISASDVSAGDILEVYAEDPSGTFYGSTSHTITESEINNRVVRIDVVVYEDHTPPVIEFIPPTPENNTKITENYVVINVSVADESDISTVILNWNGENETIFCGGLYIQSSVVNFYNWTKTNLSDGTYEYKVYANDTFGNMGVSETRVITVETEKTFNITLNQKWNLISLPIIPENTSIDEIFKNATGGDRVYAYSNGSFTSSEYYEGYGWYPKMEIVPDRGYWYYAVSAYNATITGNAAVENRTVPISAGWNLVGYTSLRTRPVGEVINEPHGGDRIYAYIEGAFESSEYYEGYGWYPEMDMEPGRGYWYYTDTPFVWEYSP